MRINVIQLLSLLANVAAQLQSQNDTFASNFRLSPKQIAAANLSQALANDVQIALRYERSNNGGSITSDPFYNLPGGIDEAKLPAPGTILKVEEYTNTSTYTLPPSLSMSRFLYVSETLNGSSVAASAYVLWPYLPRSISGLKSVSGNETSVYPVVGLAHGSSGQTQACAPSGFRALWDDFHEPFPIALAGYAVVAPDYAGLGVPDITSPYFILPAQANDLFHAVAAAQSQWPFLLSKNFVLAGQSQGGGVTWSAAQRQAQRPVEGYLGTVAVSPFTDVLADIAADAAAENNARVVAIAQGLNSVLSNFTLDRWLTDAGIARLRLVQEIMGCGTVCGYIFSGSDGVQILKDNWNTTEAAAWYSKISDNGGKPFAGPMLVLQGMEDPNANEPVTTKSVQEQCSKYPNSQLQYVRYQGITHVPALYAQQYRWLQWIEDRFSGVKIAKGCQQETLSPARGTQNIVKNQKWFLEYDLYGI
jgi:pimeloyl-ACP methyl ester carboxylesterase